MSDSFANQIALLGQGACDCNTKSPDVHMHLPTCRYRRALELADAVEAEIERLRAALASVDAAYNALKISYADLHDERDAMRKRVTESEDSERLALRNNEPLRNERDAARADVERLKAALKVFAKVAEFDEHAKPGESVPINVDRCRDARAALASLRDRP